MTLENDETLARVGGIPLNVTLHAWPLPNFRPAFKTVNDSGPSELAGGSKGFTNHSINGFPDLNSTGYVFLDDDDDDDDITDAGLTDVQTFILASVATTLPLIVVVITILCVRVAWKKYRVKKEEGYEGVLQKEESSEPSSRIQGYSLPQELKISESQFTVILEDESSTTPSTQLPTLKSNGSIITMTLKNNHLIVETEETLDMPTSLKIESKGTTTTFVTPADTDFTIGSNHDDREENDFEGELQTCQDSSILNANYGALIHYSPEDAEYELDKGSCNTGLSQSDLSGSSTETQNPSYRYGNQSAYDSGGFGYPEYGGYVAQAQEHVQFSLAKSNKTNVYCTSPSAIERHSAFVDEEHFKNILKSDIEAFDRNVEEEEEKEKRYQAKQQQIKPCHENSSNKSNQNITTSTLSVANGIHDGCDSDN